MRIAEQRRQEFMSMISHDLRTPLASLQASLEFVGEAHEEDLPNDVRECLSAANNNIQTVLTLVNELMEIARIESGTLTLEYEEIQASQLLVQAVEAVRGIAHQKEITICTEHSNAYFEADCDRLLRVLINLLGNAIKFSAARTTITLRCSETEESVEFSVQDQGRGIPAEYIEKVFARFQQVSPEDARKLGGSGLGLAISKALVEGHGGTIWVESEEGKGSIFRFVVPKNRPPIETDTTEKPTTHVEKAATDHGLISNWLRHQAIAPKDRCNSIGGIDSANPSSDPSDCSWGEAPKNSLARANRSSASLRAIDSPVKGSQWGDPYYLRPFKA